MQYPSIDHLSQNVTDFMPVPPFPVEAEENHLWYLEEKLDGSQLSIRLYSTGDDVEWRFENKGKPAIDPNTFGRTTTALRKLIDREALNPIFIYHGEAIGRPKHNVLEYHRCPRHYWVCYDIYDSVQKRFLSPDQKRIECERVGVECVPLIYYNVDPTVNPYVKAKEIIALIESGRLQSMLGGPPEGVVLKHHRFWRKGQYVSRKRKLVTAAFKESHKKGSVRMGIDANVFLEKLGKAFAVPGRFQKGVQHLREQGLMTDSFNQSKVRLHKELDRDFEKEYKGEIMEYLWNELSPEIKSWARDGSAEWFRGWHATYLEAEGRTDPDDIVPKTIEYRINEETYIVPVGCPTSIVDFAKSKKENMS